jgi:hypothetical protein
MNATERIESLSSDLKNSFETCSSCKSRNKLAATLEALSKNISKTVEWLQANEKRKYVGVRKALVAVRNVYEGLSEGVANGDLSRSEYLKLSKQLEKKWVPQVDSSLAQELEAQAAAARAANEADIQLSEKQLAAKQGLSESSNLDAELRVVQTAIRDRESSTKVEPELTVDDIRLHSLTQSRENLPQRLRGEFQVVRMPVVPLFTNPVMNIESNFKKMGLKYISIAGYAVFLDQLLLCVSRKHAKTAYGITPRELAESALSIMNERSAGPDFVLVSDRGMPNVKNADIITFWVLPVPKMNTLMRVLQSSRTTTEIKWGFPFASPTADDDKKRVVEHEQEGFKPQRSSRDDAVIRQKLEDSDAFKKARRAQQKR